MRTDRDSLPAGTGRLGLTLLLLSLSVLFASSIVGYLVIRARAEAWPPPGVPRLPAGLWLSTLAIAASSATMWWGQRSIARGRPRALAAALLATFLLGLAFLVSQTINWFAYVAREITADATLYAFGFYLLTGLHALHVLGGLAPLAVTTARALRGAYTSASRSGVEHIAMYWHFLGAVWLVLFVVLYILG